MPATGSGRQAGTVPTVPQPPEAAVRALLASAKGNSALLRAGTRDTPISSGGGSGLVKGRASVASAFGAATGVTGQAPLPGAGTASTPARSGVPYIGHGTPHPPPTGSGGNPDRGWGARSVWAESLSSSGIMGPGGHLHRPPPLPLVLAPPVAALPSTAEPGAACPISDVFSAISRVLPASRAPPGSPPPAPRQPGDGGEEGQATQLGRHQPPPPPDLPHFCPHTRPPECRRRGRRARMGGATWSRAGGARPQRPPTTPTTGGAAGEQRHPMQTVCDAHRAAACKSCGGHRGMRHWCSRHHKGYPRLVLVAGGVCQRALIWIGGLCAPPPPKKGRAATTTMGGGLTGLWRHACTHRALREPAAGPWEGGGGGHLTQGAQLFRPAATLGVCRGRGVGGAQPVLDP